MPDILRRMGPYAFERRWRDALLDAMIPALDTGPESLPPLAAIERRAFWPRFEATAPFELRFAWRFATVVLVAVAPFLLGYRTIFTRLDAPARDDVLRRASSLPGGADLLLVVKLLACFAYFDDAGVQTRIRGPSSS